MARKTTYRERLTNKTLVAGEEPIKPVRQQRAKLSLELQQPFLEGKLIVVDKPLHWTSFDVIRKLRNLLQIKKIGHAGTLDPLATGILIVCTGKFTKKINEYMAQEKEYTGSFTLGAVTPTYDLESEPTDFKDYTAITESSLQDATKNFIGELQQLPPVYSAIKKDGVALYELARRGVEVKLEPRTVKILSFEIMKIDLPRIDFKVVCSTGTYIRSLAHDYGQALGCGAYLSSLCRTRIGEIGLDSAITMEAFEQALDESIKEQGNL